MTEISDIDHDVCARLTNSLRLITEIMSSFERADDPIAAKLLPSWLRSSCLVETESLTPTQTTIVEKIAGGPLFWHGELPVRLSCPKTNPQADQKDIDWLLSILGCVNDLNNTYELTDPAWHRQVMNKMSLNSVHEPRSDRIEFLLILNPGPMRQAIDARNATRAKEQKAIEDEKRNNAKIAKHVNDKNLAEQWHLALAKADPRLYQKSNCIQKAIEAARIAILLGAVSPDQEKTLWPYRGKINSLDKKLEHPTITKWLTEYGCEPNRAGTGWNKPVQCGLGRRAGRIPYRTNAYQANRGDLPVLLHRVQDMLEDGDLNSKQIMGLDHLTPGWRDHLLLPHSLRPALRRLTSSGLWYGIESPRHHPGVTVAAWRDYLLLWQEIHGSPDETRKYGSLHHVIHADDRKYRLIKESLHIVESRPSIDLQDAIDLVIENEPRLKNYLLRY